MNVCLMCGQQVYPGTMHTCIQPSSPGVLHVPGYDLQILLELQKITALLEKLAADRGE